ncbi:hypothetical protein [Bradyrhizobium valentinum]|uniref:hypothetical protein n=1 Tax=Bradyrhizobium valentinum TaxID=1518501 RepID=UPI0007102D2D|nr:hypothetical protein [Bradyrhizobium valentinum]KRQ92547.1 hypothetical protein CQ10_36915 [Bradyrhizobium valentinum]
MTDAFAKVLAGLIVFIFFLALAGVGYVVQRYVLRQGMPDRNMSVIVGIAVLILAVFILTKIYGV